MKLIKNKSFLLKILVVIQLIFNSNLIVNNIKVDISMEYIYNMKSKIKKIEFLRNNKVNI